MFTRSRYPASSGVGDAPAATTGNGPDHFVNIAVERRLFPATGKIVPAILRIVCAPLAKRCESTVLSPGYQFMVLF